MKGLSGYEPLLGLLGLIVSLVVYHFKRLQSRVDELERRQGIQPHRSDVEAVAERLQALADEVQRLEVELARYEGIRR